MMHIKAKYIFDKENMREKIIISKFSIDDSKSTILKEYEAPFGSWFAETMNISGQTITDILARFQLLKLNEKHDICLGYYAALFKLEDTVISETGKGQLMDQFPNSDDFNSVQLELASLIDTLCSINPLFQIFKSDLFDVHGEQFLSPLFVLLNPVSKNAYDKFIVYLLKFYALILNTLKMAGHYTDKINFCYGRNNQEFEGLTNKLKHYIYTNYFQTFNTPQKVTSNIPIPQLSDEALRLPDRKKDYTLKELAEHYKNAEIKLIETVDATDISNLLHYCFTQIIQNNVPLKQCENCGDYFIPDSRSDEVYCSRITENGKTCKQIGYSNKVKGDDILSLYRTAYKTQHGKKQRSRHIPGYEEIVFTPWVEEAKKQRDLARKGKITPHEFKAWIEQNKG